MTIIRLFQEIDRLRADLNAAKTALEMQIDKVELITRPAPFNVEDK